MVLLGVACRLLFSAVRHTIRTILLHLCAASLFGGLAGIWAIEKQEFSGFMGYSMVGVISVLAIDVLAGLIAIGAKIRQDPLAVIDMIRGKK